VRARRAGRRGAAGGERRRADADTPAHAALKYRGRAYYDYARAGEEIPRPARAVRIERLALVRWEPPDAIVDVGCSKGTYVRVIAADLGERAGCGAHPRSAAPHAHGRLRRRDAVPLEVLEGSPETAERHLLPVDVLVAHLPRAEIDAAAAAAFLHGRARARGARRGPVQRVRRRPAARRRRRRRRARAAAPQPGGARLTKRRGA
jgi:tRNA pseudouridine55 synthase